MLVKWINLKNLTVAIKRLEHLRSFPCTFWCELAALAPGCESPTLFLLAARAGTCRGRGPVPRLSESGPAGGGVYGSVALLIDRSMNFSCKIEDFSCYRIRRGALRGLYRAPQPKPVLELRIQRQTRSDGARERTRAG